MRPVISGAAVVAGAGSRGLIAARLLAESNVTTTLVERLPAVERGGPESRLLKEAKSAGVDVRFASTACVWTGASLQAMSPSGTESFEASVLVVATGSRPWTRAELGIAGDRCAGILPGTAALHMIEFGLLPGRRPLIVGRGRLADRLAEALPGSVRPILVSGRSERIISAHGRSRIESVTIERGGQLEELSTDALLLAAGSAPMRNIDGAVLLDEESLGVVPCQPTAEDEPFAEVEHCAREAVARAIQAIRQITAH